jgi:hypothetical protein
VRERAEEDGGEGRKGRKGAIGMQNQAEEREWYDSIGSGEEEGQAQLWSKTTEE